jgi:DNA invertase Pin-like site-specific DNA recombinase
MRVALYLRVSTENKGQNPENQLRQLREYYQAQKWELVKEYVDYDSASKKRDGQQFIAMLDDARKKKFDVLLFWSLDRFSREGVLKTLTYLSNLSSYGVDYFSFTEQYLNTVGIFKDVVIAILATIARQESIRISERTKAGMARAKANGVKLGRKATTVDPERVVALKDSGLSWSEVSRKLSCGQATAIRLYKRARPDWQPLHNAILRHLPLTLQTKALEDAIRPEEILS